MTREDVKAMIGDFREIKNEKLLEEIIENYKDNDASYKEAYLILQNDNEANKYEEIFPFYDHEACALLDHERPFAVLDYETSFTVIDVYGNAQTYDEDYVSKMYAEIDVEKFENYFDDYFEGCGCYDRYYRSFKPLWKDIYNTIIEYRLDEEKFLSCFKNNDGDDIDYDTVQNFQYCLKNDQVSDFIKEYYNPSL